MEEKIFVKTDEGVIIRVKVIANASKNGFEKCDEFLKLRIKAPAVDNKANEEIVKFLSKTFDCSKSKIKILKGQKSSHKSILIEGVTVEESFFG